MDATHLSSEHARGLNRRRLKMARRLSFGGIVGLGIAAYVGYQYFTADADLCSRDTVKNTLSKLVLDNKIGTGLKVTAVRTEKKDGRKTMCAAQFDWTRSDNAKSESLSSIHYSAIPTDDGVHIMIEIPAPDILAMRLEGVDE